MMSVSRAPSRRLAAANRRLDRVGTQAEPGHVGGDPPGHELGQQHAQQPFDLVDRLAAEVAGKERPGQHGERDATHLAVEGKRPACRPPADPRDSDIPHRVQVAGDLRAVERRLHEPPLPAVAFAFRHHQPVAYQPLGPAEVEALLQLPGLADQRLPDGIRAVQQVDVERPEPDADHVAVLPGPLQQRERVAAELGRVPEQPPPARHQRRSARDLSAGQDHLPRSSGKRSGCPRCRQA